MAPCRRRRRRRAGRHAVRRGGCPDNRARSTSVTRNFIDRGMVSNIVLTMYEFACRETGKRVQVELPEASRADHDDEIEDDLDDGMIGELPRGAVLRSLHDISEDRLHRTLSDLSLAMKRRDYDGVVTRCERLLNNAPETTS